MGLRSLPYEIFYRIGLYRVAWHDDAPFGDLVTLKDKWLPEGGRALEIGCGAGTNAVWLAQQGYETTAIDFAPAAIDHTRKRAESAGVQLFAERVDVTRPKMFDAPFNLIFDRECLQDLKTRLQRQAYAANVQRWLAPGGTFVVATWLSRSLAERRKWFPTSRLPEQEVPYLFPFLEVALKWAEVRQLYRTRGLHCTYVLRARDG